MVETAMDAALAERKGYHDITEPSQEPSESQPFHAP
jgi:hypothetical protein